MFLLGRTLRCPRAGLSLIVCCLELGNLLPRFIYGKDSGRSPRVDGCAGECGEWVQELPTGGTNFFTLNIIDSTENSVSVQPFQPHGFRISGRPSTSSHFQDVVVADQRVISFPEYFIKEDENAVVMIPLVPIFPSTEFLKHSVPISSENDLMEANQVVQAARLKREAEALEFTNDNPVISK
ncbi:hypothetical protein EV359DRAFT_68502 [Lentinula novae-zelandiae]|nr:hypothetical protein EV359DRAFT_68502 [Lentinula novae-zelandiae]